MSKGKVFFVGAGPGDPKLLTLKGLECIQSADVIVYDRLANPVLLEHAKQTAEFIYCGKLPDDHALRQETINSLLVEKAMEGKLVTRLKGGDPCVFGRVGEEAYELKKNNIEYEIVPGVTSGIAVPAYAGIPVTHREYSSSFAMVTGHTIGAEKESVNKWKALATGIDTIAFYMGVNKLPFIRDQLIQYGRDPKEPVAVISWGTTEKQVTVTGTLENVVSLVAESKITHPAIILVGEVVHLRDKISWFEKQEEPVME